MKIRRRKWIEYAVIGVVVMSNLSAYAMNGDKIFGRKFEFLRQVYGNAGIAVITAVNSLKNIEPKVVSLFESTLNSEQVERDRQPIDLNTMAKQDIINNQNKNLKALSKLFVCNFMRSDCETVQALKDHCQKHFASSDSLNVQKNLEKENFCQKYTLDDSINGTLILRGDPYEKVLEYLLSSEPMLRYDSKKSSVFVEITKPFFLRPGTYEHFICIVGTSGAKLIDGVLYVISDMDAVKSSFFSLWTITCWDECGKKIKSNPGSMYFKICADFSTYEPTEEQAELAAILRLKKTFEVINFEESHLFEALTYITNLQKTQKEKTYNQLYRPLQKILEEKSSAKLRALKLVVPAVFHNLHTENLHRDTQELIKEQQELGKWYLSFVRAYENAMPLADAMKRWSNLGIDPVMLTWGHKDELQRLLDERKDLVEIMKGWAHFMFVPQEKCFIDKRKDIGSLFAQTVTIALMEMNMNKISVYMKWLVENVYLFSVLYQFAEKDVVSDDYISILYAFRYRFPYGQWTYSEAGINSVEMDKQMKFLLDEAKKRSNKFRKEDEEYSANCGFARIGQACVLFLSASEQCKYIGNGTMRLWTQIYAQPPKTQAELLSLEVIGILRKEKPDLINELQEKQKLKKQKMPEILLEVLENNETQVNL